MASWSRILVAIAAFGAILWALPVVPGWFGHADGIKSASQVAGYNNKTAHLIAVSWLVMMVVLAFVMEPDEGIAERTTHRHPQSLRSNLILPVLTAVAVVFLYFPPAFAWRGPFFEESIHVNALHRMFAGDLPFRDFEFLYGPLMLYVPWLWTKAFGLSLPGYYTYILVLELVTLGLLLIPIQRYIAGFWWRLGAFLLISSLYFNVMIGPNQNGMRKLLGPLLLLSVAAYPMRPVFWVLHGVCLGFLLGYSQEFGAATAIAIAGIYAAILIKTGNVRAILAVSTIAVVSLLVWLGLIRMMLGPDIGAYFISLKYLTTQFDGGEAAFPLYWTVNSVALFALLALGAWLTGGLLARKWPEMPAQGDLILLGGVLYAAVALKSGLSRSDQWHLDPVVLVLCFAVILPLSLRYARLNLNQRVIGILLVLILALSYSLGQLRIARYTFYESMLSGLTAWATEERIDCNFEYAPALPVLACDNGEPAPDMVALATRLSAPDLSGRPVFTFIGPSTLAARVGVRRHGYLTDEFVYGDTRAQEAQISLAADPGTLVVIQQSDLDWLRLGPDAPVSKAAFPLSGNAKQRKFLGRVSSSHYRVLQDERDVQMDRWRNFIGNWIIANYTPLFTAGKFVVMHSNIMSGSDNG